MSRYIDADELKSRMLNYYDCVSESTDKSNYRGETLMNYEVADMIEDCIDNAPTADVAPRAEWISVGERLPENDWGKHWKERKYYLVFTKPSGLMNVAVYGYKEHDWWIDRNSCVLDKKNYNEVTHWMPLPEPPDMKGV